MSLFWRVFVLNAVVFALGTMVLVFSPVTVSFPTTVTELLILGGGLGVMLVANAVLLRWALAPLDRLRRHMARVDLLRPGERLAPPHAREFAALVRGFNDMLDRLEGERRDSAARALQAQEAERRRIARELHDEVGQSLTAVLLQLRTVPPHAPPEIHANVEEARELVRESLGEVRRIARQLRPGVLEDLGLVSALTALTSGFADRTGQRVERSLDPQLPALDRDVELALYRVAQESLTNVARHAGASRVEVTLARAGAAVVLEVSDDGRGPRVADGEAGGIRGMRERALLVGADLSIEHGPRGGTVVRLAVPVPAAAAAQANTADAAAADAAATEADPAEADPAEADPAEADPARPGRGQQPAAAVGSTGAGQGEP